VQRPSGRAFPEGRARGRTAASDEDAAVGRTGGERTFAPLALAGLSVVALLAAGRVARFVTDVRSAIRSAHAWRPATLPARPGARRSLLVVGDSLALGAGSPDGTHGIAAAIAREFPHVEVRNAAALGARTAGVIAQIARSGREHWDVIVVEVGANDVMRMRPIARIRAELEAALRFARERSTQIVVCSSANVGGAPIFFWPLDRLLDRRSLALRDAFARTCAAAAVPFVSLCFERPRDPFGRVPQLFYAADGLHPTPAAYRVSYRALKSAVPLAAWLREEGAPLATAQRSGSRSGGGVSSPSATIGRPAAS
jgi:lysophospholipase L1-like esterase